MIDGLKIQKQARENSTKTICIPIMQNCYTRMESQSVRLPVGMNTNCPMRQKVLNNLINLGRGNCNDSRRL